jgi:hypothetical protein
MTNCVLSHNATAHIDTAKHEAMLCGCLIATRLTLQPPNQPEMASRVITFNGDIVKAVAIFVSPGWEAVTPWWWVGFAGGRQY